MKTSILMILMLALLTLPVAMQAQQQPIPATSRTPSSTNPTIAQPGTTAEPSGTSMPSDEVSDPETADPFETPTEEPAEQQPADDYHLTQPAPSPVGAQIGTQNVHQPAMSPIPYNQLPGDMMRVEKEQLPDEMVEKLSNPLYKGWESSTIYYNRGTNEYSFDIRSDTEIKNYRFDADGNPVEQKDLDDQ